jgi:hypothetical protein
MHIDFDQWDQPNTGVGVCIRLWSYRDIFPGAKYGIVGFTRYDIMHTYRTVFSSN